LQPIQKQETWIVQDNLEFVKELHVETPEWMPLELRFGNISLPYLMIVPHLTCRTMHTILDMSGVALSVGVRMFLRPALPFPQGLAANFLRE
jgi:hypothetical protein